MMWVWLLGCAGTDPAVIARIEALEQEVESLRVADAPAVEDDAPMTTEARDERLKRLTDRLQERQAKQAGPSTVREAFADPEVLARLGRGLLHKDEDGAYSAAGPS